MKFYNKKYICCFILVIILSFFIYSINNNSITKNNHITLMLKEGLGNQLFQYATAYSIAKKNNYGLLVDTSFYNTYHLNEICGYQLNKIVPNMQETKTMFYEQIQKMPQPFNCFGNFFREIYLKSKKKYIEKVNTVAYDCKVNDIKDNSFIEGYFINQQYFSEYSDEIIKLFSNMPLSNSGLAIAEKIKMQSSHTVAIHCRDYSDSKAGGEYYKKVLGLLDRNYYLNAINIIKEKIKAPKVYVFSNKINFAKSLLSDIEDLEFVEYNPENTWEDMKLMSLCDHNVIANSTYSYWGAYLNTNKDKIVIAPEKLFVWQSSVDTDIFPESWVKIKATFQ